MTDALARALVGQGTVMEPDRRRASELLGAIGVDDALEALELAERIIKVGEGFHSVERFFVEGSPEHRYLVEMLRSGR
jgi:hypothetical protein